MENGLVVGLSAQLALRRSMEITANNIANVSTSGFKREAPLFEPVYVEVDAPNRLAGQSQVAFVRDYGVMRDMTSGGLEQTGAALDVAIDGPGYYTVQTPQGERFTRDGHFKQDSSGTLVTTQGFPVLGDGGPISIAPGATDIKIAPDGTVSSSSGLSGKIRIVEFAEPHRLKKEGLNLYASEAAPQTATAPRVAQGMLERSNVQGVVEITRMIEIMRTYQAVSETINLQEDTVRRAVQKLGEVKA